MKKILLAIAVLALSMTAVAQAPSQPATKHPVEARYWAGIDAFNKHDLDAFMQQFDADMQMFNTSTGWLRTRDEVRARFATVFAKFPKVHMDIEDLRVREVVPGTALVDFAWTLYPMGQGPAYRGVGSGVYVLRDGKWGETFEHETLTGVDPELKSPPSAAAADGK